MKRFPSVANGLLAIGAIALAPLLTGDARRVSGDSSLPVAAAAKGYTWTRAAADLGWGEIAPLALAVYDERLWAVVQKAIRHSSDGESWTRVRSPAPAGWQTLFAGNLLVGGDTLWALAGTTVWQSRDGSTWTRVTAHAPYGARGWPAAAFFAGKLWVLGGFDGTPKNDVWASSDGVQWIRVTEHAPWTARAEHRAVVFEDRLWILGGDIERTGLQDIFCNDVWCSTDGRHWTQVTASAGWSQRASHAVAAYDGMLWVLGGYGKDDAWYSEDGAHWQRATDNAGWMPWARFSVAVFRDKLWVMGGKTGSHPGLPADVWYLSRAR